MSRYRNIVVGDILWLSDCELNELLFLLLSVEKVCVLCRFVEKLRSRLFSNYSKKNVSAYKSYTMPCYLPITICSFINSIKINCLQTRVSIFLIASSPCYSSANKYWLAWLRYALSRYLITYPVATSYTYLATAR